MKRRFATTGTDIINGGTTLAQVRTSVAPAGTVVWFTSTTNIPDGWKRCDGDILNKNDYPELWSALGGYFEYDATRFKLPDLRGEFVKGANDSSEVGHWENYSFQSHTHSLNGGITSSGSNHYHFYYAYTHGDHDGEHWHGIPVGNGGAPGNGIGPMQPSNYNTDGDWHSVPMSFSSSPVGNHTHNFSISFNNGGSHSHGLILNPTTSTGSDKILPKNIALVALIKV